MLRWPASGGIQEATEGEIIIETVWEPKVVKEDKWVTQWKSAGKWTPWQSVPFTMNHDKYAGGEVDVEMLDASHKRNEYPKGDNEEGVVAKKKLFRRRGEGCLNMLQVSGTSATELAITLKASPVLCKLTTNY